MPARGFRARLVILGPLAWLVAIVVVAIVIHQANSVGIALLIVVGSFLLALVILLPMRARRVREEREQ